MGETAATYLEIGWFRLVLSLGLVAMALVLSHRKGLGLGIDLVIGTVRSALQLIAIGFVLVVLFARDELWLTLLSLLVMTAVAASTAARRVSHGPGWKVLFFRAFLAIGSAFLVVLLPVLAWVIQVRPLLSARFAIPLGGMVLAAGMNTAALVFDRLFSAAHSDSERVEQALALGATPRQALAPLERQAIKAAMIPSINALLTVGLVQLPGMMTGQILSGTDPTHAVRYQLVIMYQLVAVGSVAGTLASVLARGVLFDQAARLRSFRA